MFGETIKQCKSMALYEEYSRSVISDDAIEYAVMDVVAVRRIWENMHLAYNVDDYPSIGVGRVRVHVPRHSVDSVAVNYQWCPYDMNQMLTVQGARSVAFQRFAGVSLPADHIIEFYDVGSGSSGKHCAAQVILSAISFRRHGKTMARLSNPDEVLESEMRFPGAMEMLRPS